MQQDDETSQLDGDRSRALVATIVGLGVAGLAWMGRSLVTGEVPFTGDLLHFHYPLRAFYADALARGQRFDWMPSFFTGFYVVGEGQLGAYHPLHWLLYGVLPLQPAFAIELVVAYPVAALGTWLWLRRVCGTHAAAFGALLFACCGFNLQHGAHPNMVGVVAHLPWLLWAIDGALGSSGAGRAARWCAVIGLLSGSQILLGHPQAVWFSGLVSAMYLALRVATAGPGRRRTGIAVVLGGGILGLAIGAVQLLATLDAVATSVRPSDAASATAFSLPPVHLLQLVQPYAVWGRVLRWNEAPGAGDEHGAYGGAVTLVLAGWWLAHALGRRRAELPTDQRRFGLWAAAVGLLGLWLATGSYGGLYYAQTWLPIVRQFRAPVRYVLLFDLALACLAALALAALLRRSGGSESWRRRALWAPWLVVASSIVASALLLRVPGTEAARLGVGDVAAWLAPVVFLTAALTLTAATRGKRWAVSALIVLAAADLGLYGLGGVVAWQDFIPRESVVPLLGPAERRPPVDAGRIHRGGFQNLYTLDGYRLLDGYVAIAPRKSLRQTSLQTLRAAGVAYVFKADVPAGAPEAPLLGNEWYPVPGVPARVRLVTAAVESQQPAVDIEKVDLAAVALVQRPVVLPSGPAGRVQVVTDEPGRFGLRTMTDSAQLLVVSESYDAGWKATVDGQAAAVERVNGDFMGVVVPAGAHNVALEFAPVHLWWGKVVSAAGLLFAAALVVAGSGRTRQFTSKR